MRYFPQTPEDVTEMLNALGMTNIEDLFSHLPTEYRTKQGIDLPGPMTEWQLDAHMDSLASRVAVSPEYKVFIGAGSYEHYLPASVKHLLQRSEFVTAYTPYQPEMSQGTLQAIYEFQSLCCRLLDMEIANASHYDGATALAEAIILAIRKNGRKRIAVSRLVHPLHRQVIATYLRPMNCVIEELAIRNDGRTDPNSLTDQEYDAIIIQSPNFFGSIEDLASFAALAQSREALFIVSFTEPLAYGIVKSPGSLGADIVTGEGQSLGLPRSFGGPGLGIFTSTKPLMRRLPGRLVGQTVDLEGERGYVLTLSTREQHIRREKATSNICSNNGLCAVAAAMYLASLGGTGLTELASLNRNKTEYLKKIMREAEITIPYSSPTFNEFVADLGSGFAKTYERLLDKKIIAGLPLNTYYPELEGLYLFCATEVMKKEDMDRLVAEIKS